MARGRSGVLRWAILFVALALVAAACTNGDGARTAGKKRPSAKSRTPTEQPPSSDGATGGDALADPSTQTTSTANGQPVTGRQLLEASRARFTRPLPTVVPTTAGVASPPTSTPPTTQPGGPGDTGPGVVDLRPSQEIIAADYEGGKITYSQYLLYRAYALFWDPRLPAAYDGIGSTGEDDFFTEARLHFSQLDATTQAALAPFLERPASPQGYGCPLTENGQPVSWLDSGAASSYFKVWACGTNGAHDDIGNVVATLNALYPAMTDPAAMGPPVSDSDGGDARIDVYLLDSVPTRERAGIQRPIDGDTIGAVSAAGPFVGATASSYLMIGRPRVANQGAMRRTLIHELFHSLQYAHNFSITTVDPGLEPWFFEASAAWAEQQFARSGSTRVHRDYFTNGFRTAPDLPLELPAAVGGPASPRQHPSWAYLWPFFMQQQAGGDAGPVFDAWNAVEGAADWDAFHAAIDAQLPFETSFRDFTVRNMNLDLGPASEPHYSGLDANFPDNVRPVLSSDIAITQADTITVPIGGPEGDGLPSLSTQYDHVAIEPQSNTRSLVLDFTNIPKGMDVTVLTQATDGTWTRHDLGPTERLEFDFTAPGGAVSEFYVILGNHEREPNWSKPGSGLLLGSYDIANKS